MASTESSISRIRVVRRKYRWPATQLNVWLFVVMVASSVVMGVFASFAAVQTQLLLGTPWYFTYNIVTSALGILFLLTTISLIHQRSLLPGIMLLGSLILLILWLVGLIVVSIELWGPQGNVAGNCQLYVQNRVSVGQSLDTLAWLEQNTICQSWKAAWAFQLVGVVFFFWMMIMSYQVYKDE